MEITGSELKKYQYVVGYGIGQYYEYVKKRVPSDIHLDYLCDARWEQIGRKYDGIEVISPNMLCSFQNVFVIIFSGNPRTFMSIRSTLDKIGVRYAHAEKLISVGYSISGRRLKELGREIYTDSRGNKIEYCRDIEDTITVRFHGDDNLIQIEENVSVGKLDIFCGSKSKCRIGKGTEIEEAKLYVTNGSVTIGEDCLFSTQVILRNNDTHHIFDKDTGKRINQAGNMLVGNHVWLGHGVTLLGSATIGDNSIVGTEAVTSGTFPKEVIIAGNPARVIRERVCWSKDNTNFFNREYYGECLAKEASKYF